MVDSAALEENRRKHMWSIDEHVRMAQGEQLIKEYHATQCYGLMRRLDGKLALTNKRVIACTKGTELFGEHAEVNEIELDRTEGVEVGSWLDFNWVTFVAGIAIVVGGFLTDSLVRDILGQGAPFSILSGLVVGGLLILFSFKRRFRVAVRSVGSGTGEPRNHPVLDASGLMVSRVHGPDADELLKGLGSMVLDIKLGGEAILEYLKCPNPECRYIRSLDHKPPKHCPECGASWSKVPGSGLTRE